MTLYSRLSPIDRFEYAFLHTLDPIPTFPDERRMAALLVLQCGTMRPEVGSCGPTPSHLRCPDVDQVPTRRWGKFLPRSLIDWGGRGRHLIG